MRVIHKFPINLGANEITLVDDAIVVHVGVQEGKITLWIECELNTVTTEHRIFLVYGTGHSIGPFDEYVGTVQIGRYVWHVYEVKE